ncbi:MAG: hypothetical protein KIA08_02325 [Clostridium baratii]|uniref:YncE family protein n=1 Tax=Clostridium baratii TaxID=1561 RepID=UPI0024313983|nr:hypothetical protein [Clostridium baratii]MBS6041513.1 hypothetical protein [Clostridium baratii]
MIKRGKMYKVIFKVLIISAIITPMAGCSNLKNVEESSILLEDVKEDANKNEFKVISKEEYKITGDIKYDLSFSYSVKDDGIYVKFDNGKNESIIKKVSLENGEAKVDKNKPIIKPMYTLNNSTEIYNKVDDYIIKEKISNSIKDGATEVNNITIYTEKIKNSSKPNEKEGILKEEVSIDIPSDINYFNTIGIKNNKLIYASGAKGGQFANEIGVIDLETKKVEKPIKIDAYSQAVSIDENTIVMSTITSNGNDLHILNLKNKSKNTIVKDKNIWYLGISKNKEKIYYVEESDSKKTAYVASISGENKGEVCKIYETSNEDRFDIDISADGKEVYIFLYEKEPSIIKYKLNK